MINYLLIEKKSDLFTERILLVSVIWKGGKQKFKLIINQLKNNESFS